MKRTNRGHFGMLILCGMLLAGCSQTEESQYAEDMQYKEGAQPEENYTFDFQGLQEAAEAPEWGNHIMNLKQNICGLVCPDGDGGTYYVNCGRDDYLYRLKNGESTLVLEQVVSSLNIWEGELYFVSHEDGDIRGMGNICKWNPDTREQEIIIEGAVQYFRMNGSGIYFVEGQFMEFENGYITSLLPKYYSFEGDCITEHSYGNGDVYGDFVMKTLVTDNKMVGYGLYHLKTEELIPVYQATEKQFLVNECIWGDSYYGIRNDEEEFVQINMQDGTVCKTGIEDIEAAWVKLKDYTELNGEIFLSLESEVLARWDKESQSLEPIEVETGNHQLLTLEEIEEGQYEEEIAYSYHELYTDGESLYALKHYIVHSEQALNDGLLLVQLKPQGDTFVEIALGDNEDE